MNPEERKEFFQGIADNFNDWLIEFMLFGDFMVCFTLFPIPEVCDLKSILGKIIFFFFLLPKNLPPADTALVL